MIPYLDKTIVKIGLAITLIGLLFKIATWGYNSIYEAGANSVRAEIAANSVTTLVSEVENSNEDTISLQEHNIAIENAKAEAKRANQGVPSASPTVDCPIDEFERMYEQIKFTAH
jgi:uncharacterized membrane protein